MPVRVSKGNILEPDGLALTNLREFLPSRKQNPTGKCGDMPYTEPLDSVKSISIEPNGKIAVCNDFHIGNASRNSILNILENYNPFKIPEMREIIENGMMGLVNWAKKKGVEPNPSGYYSICQMCMDLRKRAMNSIKRLEYEQQLRQEDLKEIVLTHSPSGRKLQNQIELQLPQANSPGERMIHEYVINALSWKMPALIQFTFNNSTVLEVAKHLKRHATGSQATLYQYVYGIHRFCKWINEDPDTIISDSKEASSKYVRLIDDFIGDLQATNLAPGTIANHVKGVKALFRSNGVLLTLNYRVPRRVKYNDRAPTPEELTKVLNAANLREKVIVSLMALGGFRTGTLVKLQYRHVIKDLERNIMPVHIYVEAEITKGKYHDYDTFIGSEAVQFLKIYLETRRTGTRKIPPEHLKGESPLIRAELKKVRPITAGNVHSLVHKLYVKVGLITSKKRRYELRAHSLRKYFRTQLGSLSTIPTDYIEYMMGHTISTYNDIKMKGIEFLRELYAKSGLSIKPKTKISKIEQLRLIIEAWGMDPNKILSKEALSSPHRTVANNQENEIRILNKALKQAILKELQQA